MDERVSIGRVSVPVPSFRVRQVVQAALDPAVAMVALVVALWIRFEAAIPSESLSALLWVMPLVGGVQLAIGWHQGLYVGRWRFGGFEELSALARSVLATSTALFLVMVPLAPRPIPLGACVAQFLVTLLVCAGARGVWRIVLERNLRPEGDHLTRVVVVGAGEAGTELVESMLRNPRGRYLPVAMADDSFVKQRLRVSGVPVKGTTTQICEIAGEVDAATVIVAIPSADGAVIRGIAEQASGCGLEVLVLPPVHELLGGQVEDSDVRPLTEADLLGRRQIETDLDAIAGYVTGRRVLVTGAGGSIGSELCRQLHRLAPEALVMLDRDESALHGVQLAIEGRALLDDRNLVVADIRDVDRLDAVFAEHRPQVVFHAAALKHLPLLEMHPSEAVKSNVGGTHNLLEASLAHEVDHFVNISTDKAADPTSVLGASKRVAERLTAEAARRTSGRFVSVRFGNVLGSRGSVLTTFRAQIDAGGPVTVTHADATRYFMTVEEAVQLVIQAGAIGSGGDALVFDMGEPVRIDDVARRLIDQAGTRVEVAYTGLRPGEKLHEVLIGTDESPRPTDHELISSVAVTPLAGDAVDGLAGRGRGQVVAALLALAGAGSDDLLRQP